jgi:hypothetical protein
VRQNSSNYDGSKGKRPLGKTRRRWEDNIKMDYQEMRSGGINLVRAGSG